MPFEKRKMTNLDSLLDEAAFLNGGHCDEGTRSRHEVVESE